VKFGVDKERVCVTGIPIRPAFARPPQDRTELKKQLGLDPDKPFVLILGGALGSVDFNAMARSLDGLPNDFQVAVICGKNEGAKKKLEGETFKHKVIPLGFVTNMVDYIDACDLIVSKPGGLSSSEILARGRPILILDPIPGLEVQNARRLTAAGVGVWAKDQNDMVKHAGRLLGDPKAREAMEAAALKMGKPDSASAAANEILASAWENRLLSGNHTDGSY
jgi:processive 1,2-diacylglycerol beta-glucosyltransferase